MPEIPESFHADVHDDTVIDADQLVRITSLHRGFLYQHLYAAACLLRFTTAGMHRLLVERDEDLEAVLPGRHLYLQVKTRSRPLRWGDVSGAVDGFAAVRARHSEGKRAGQPQLVIVANVPPRPATGHEDGGGRLARRRQRLDPASGGSGGVASAGLERS